MSPDSLFEEADLIHSYSRKQAIEDGVLVDLMQPGLVELVKEAGFRFPIAMTSTAYADAIGPIEGDLPSGQDRTGRLWDVLMVLKAMIRRAEPDEDRIHFEVRVWNGKKHEIVRLWSLCGPGDTPEPVITIMVEGED